MSFRNWPLCQLGDGNCIKFLPSSSEDHKYIHKYDILFFSIHMMMIYWLKFLFEYRTDPFIPSKKKAIKAKTFNACSCFCRQKASVFTTFGLEIDKTVLFKNTSLLPLKTIHHSSFHCIKALNVALYNLPVALDVCNSTGKQVNYR